MYSGWGASPKPLQNREQVPGAPHTRVYLVAEKPARGSQDRKTGVEKPEFYPATQPRSWCGLRRLVHAVSTGRAPAGVVPWLAMIRSRSTSQAISSCSSVNSPVGPINSSRNTPRASGRSRVLRHKRYASPPPTPTLSKKVGKRSPTPCAAGVIGRLGEWIARTQFADRSPTALGDVEFVCTFGGTN
jgi:hypothetical protein